MEKKKYIKFIKNKREIGKIIIYLMLAIMLVFSMKAIAAEILANSASVIADEKTIVRTAAAVSKGASSTNQVEIGSLTTELGRYASTEVASISSEIIQVTFNRTGNIYEIDVNEGPTFDIIEETLPYLPLGYTPVENTDLESGFVIEDENGNQFVWVEVPRTTTVYPTAGLEIENFTSEEFEQIENDLHTYTSVYRNGTTYTDTWSSEEATGLTETEYNTLKKKMLKSIYKNGGFYVGRYETGIDYSESYRTAAGQTTQTPVIKQNSYPYTYITAPQSQILAESFKTTGYETSLMFGVQWDLIMKYLETSGAATGAELKDDSTSWGNHQNTTYNITNTNARHSLDDGATWSSESYGKTTTEKVLLSTGSLDIFKKQNISDLAGNVWERTLENANTENYPNGCRGGTMGWPGSTYPVSTRTDQAGNSSYYYVGFRVCLYKDEGTYTPDENEQPPYIPNGYTAIDGTMDTGFVIADSLGNEYVWVEVPQTVAVYQTAGLSITAFTEEEFGQIENDLKTYTSTYSMTTIGDTYVSEEVNGITETEYNTLKKKMLKSIYKNGGFYVGRYETGIDYSEGPRTVVAGETTQTPIIKQNAYPYSYVTSSQAQILATSFKSTGYETSLLFGIQWNLTLKYLETSGAATQAQLISDSTSWGNYYDSTYNITNTNAKYNAVGGSGWIDGTYEKTSGRLRLTTGASEIFKKQNIYDLAGNVDEWTGMSDGTRNAQRGGDGYYSGIDRPANYVRYTTTPGQAWDGFRVCLYKDEGTSAYDAPTYIPYGYAHVAGTDMDTGFVIEDESGNQYVWVEVPKTTSVYKTAGTGIALFTDAEFEAIENDLQTYTSAYKAGPAAEGYNFIDEYYSDNTTGLTEAQYNIQKKKMLKSIYKNGGFYVGRYETGITDSFRTAATDSLQTPVIKQNTYPYNFVTTSQAQTLSSSFASEGYTSSLMFGVQWDLMLKYIETKGTAQTELTTDSTAWGNYSNSTYTITNEHAKYSVDGTSFITTLPYTHNNGDWASLTTGANSNFSKQNIYDIGGNVAEWILSYAYGKGNNSTERGGNAGNNGDFRPAGDGGSDATGSSVQHIGFRVSLYKDEGIGITAAYIPEGYTQVSGTNLDNGLVVQDASGNEYVWVKVPRTTTVYPTAGLNIESFTDAEYDAIEYDLNAYTSTYGGAVITSSYSDTYNSLMGLTESEYYGLKKNMLKSVYINGGFYVGRYETGIATARGSGSDALGTAVIKQNVYPYNYITNVQAQELATTFATDGYTSSLLYGIQWDLVMKHIELSGEATQDQLKTDSTSWGNFYASSWNVTNTSAKYWNGSSWTSGAYGSKAANTSVMLSTGASETFKKQNIYDLGGNVWEFTIEKFVTSEEDRISVRGNYYGSTSVVSAANTRGGVQPTAQAYRGFRVSLFKDEGASLKRSYDASNLDGNGTTGTSTTTLKDLSGNYDATIYNSPTFGNGYISLNEGSSSDTQYIDMGPMTNLSKVTVNCKFSVSETGIGHHLLGNWQSGGFGMSINAAGLIGFAVYTEAGTTYETVRSTTVVAANTIYDVTGIYDGQYLYIYVNGVLEGTLETTGGNIKNPTYGEHTLIGANPCKTTIDTGDLAKMKLYSAKVWTAP